jgi:hypothetical protein
MEARKLAITMSRPLIAMIMLAYAAPHSSVKPRDGVDSATNARNIPIGMYTEALVSARGRYEAVVLESTWDLTHIGSFQGTD